MGIDKRVGELVVQSYGVGGTMTTILLSLVSNSKMAKGPSSKTAVTMHKNMVIISSKPHNSGKITRIIIPVKLNLRFLLGYMILKSYFFKYNLNSFPKSQQIGVLKTLYLKVVTLQMSNHLTAKSSWAPNYLLLMQAYVPVQLTGRKGLFLKFIIHLSL